MSRCPCDKHRLLAPMLGSLREAPPTEGARARTIGATVTWLQSLLRLRRQRRALARSLLKRMAACAAAAAAGVAATEPLLPWQETQPPVSKHDLTLQPAQCGSQQKQPNIERKVTALVICS